MTTTIFEVPALLGHDAGPLVGLWAGQLEFAEAVALNAESAIAVAGGAPAQILAFEPATPVLTLGRRAAAAAESRPDPNLGRTLALCAQRGIPVLRADRGGLATLHIPGQLVVFIAINLPRSGVRSVVCALLGAARDVAQGWDRVPILRDDRDAGLWIGDAKLAAIGLRVQSGVVSHGLSLNVGVDRQWSAGLTLCGHAQAQMADLGLYLPDACQRAAQRYFRALAAPGSRCALW